MFKYIIIYLFLSTGVFSQRIIPLNYKCYNHSDIYLSITDNNIFYINHNYNLQTKCNFILEINNISNINQDYRIYIIFKDDEIIKNTECINTYIINFNGKINNISSLIFYNKFNFWYSNIIKFNDLNNIINILFKIDTINCHKNKRFVEIEFKISN